MYSTPGLLWVPLFATVSLSQPAGLHVRDESRIIITDPDTGRSFVAGGTSTDRTIFNTVSLFCAILLGVLFGQRVKTLKNNILRKRTFTSILVLVLFIFGFGFVFCATVVETGQNLRTHQLCYSAAMICLVFYTGNKLTIYIFLLERARVVRAPFFPRRKDHIWLAGMFILLGGFGTIAIIGYLSPTVELSKLDGKCRIGLPSKVSFPLLSFDVGVNFMLTGLFFWLLSPVIDLRSLLSVKGVFGNGIKKQEQSQTQTTEGAGFGGPMNNHIKVLLWKSLTGSALVMFPTVANMAQFYIMKGREQAWICMTLCVLDISWGIMVINWLTIGSIEAEKQLTTLMTQRSVAQRGGTPDNDDSELQTRYESDTHDLGIAVEVPVHFKQASLRDEGGLLGDGNATRDGIQRRTSISISFRSQQGEDVKVISMV
ncbi:hypothetical protein P153DRAFT_389497 [Dothidotthia symphoricarpi CBS 119687]|uniref:G-protein coupled receptors family 1 profile domain-containing protein n=1 Tax=Dothidotthia symphoricarpi CBS 119687 TaxID=1392245 RepID=A0A6A6A2D0_9PLEO|nr:uncharacterized protein P153DRAFT_389497 [Dothidotthia symphoricarpi CBS 119687]KAF2125334.1 hypothetical protein P153DRAFT_389497 [Dothidotthia symphoricarpi CBS 119687]